MLIGTENGSGRGRGGGGEIKGLFEGLMLSTGGTGETVMPSGAASESLIIFGKAIFSG